MRKLIYAITQLAIGHLAKARLDNSQSLRLGGCEWKETNSRCCIGTLHGPFLLVLIAYHSKEDRLRVHIAQNQATSRSKHHAHSLHRAYFDVGHLESS